MMIPIYQGISKLFLIRTLNQPGAVDFDGDLGDLAILRKRRVGFSLLIGADTPRQTLASQLLPRCELRPTLQRLE
jgi:hypothetical protein